MKPRVATNALGNIQAFQEIEREMRVAALANAEQRDPQTYHLAAWPARLVGAARQAGVEHISFVKLPATTAFERAFFPDSAHRQGFEDFMGRLARHHGGQFIDLSQQPWVQDSLVVDGLHYSPQGATLISQALGRSLGGHSSQP